jgi:uncharacterized membrane protein
MTYIIATIVILLSFVIFSLLWKSILFTLFIHIPKGLTTEKTEQSKEEMLKLVKFLFISVLLVLIILLILYFLFNKYNFGYSISTFIGCTLALFGSMSETIKLRSINKKFDL